MATLAEDELTLAAYARDLADTIDAALAPWVEAAVGRRASGLDGAAATAGERCRLELGPKIRSLLDTDIDEQRSTPLALLRHASRYATSVLSDAHVAPAPRDEFARRVEPDDVFDLSPATWADFGDAVGQAGLVWGAAKAHVHLRRRGLR
jgi:hypothetical protein